MNRLVVGMQRLSRSLSVVSSSGIILLLLLLPLLLTAGPVVVSYAQTDARYVPETGHFIRGVFRHFWETEGGLDTFGYPLTEEYVSHETGRITQYFERARFELVEQGGQYRVELGNLGLEVTAGRVFPTAALVQDTAQRRYLSQTRHIIQYGFKEIWETHGSERIFGYPISEELEEMTDDGRMRTVQYFERVRFEYWPEFPPGERVVFSALGRFLAPPALMTPLPPGAAPGTLPPAPPGAAPSTPPPVQPAAPPPAEQPLPEIQKVLFDAD
ncbi:MAG: hypothetical protein HC884_03270 [Chloroflexaceae bacterium]|nr:hypothetical protein [Chloroflexaceae bacterium]